MSTGKICRIAWLRARMDLHNQVTSGKIFQWVGFNIASCVVLFFLRDLTVMGTSISLGGLGISAMLVTGLFFGGFFGVAVQMLTDRSDGTLLRAKTTPHGITTYLLGNGMALTILCATSAIPLLGAAALAFPDAVPKTVTGWLLTGAFIGLALTVSIPLGALAGAVLPGPGTLGLLGVVAYGVVAISGLFYPLKALPEGLQIIAQVFPLYWLGVGTRAGLLSADGQNLELGGQWALGLAVLITVLWSVAAGILAVITVRRMTKKASCASVTALQKKYSFEGAA